MSYRARSVASFGALLVLAACGGGGGGGGAGGGGGGQVPTSSVAGRVIFDRGPLGAISESEPNDSVSRPHPLGSVYAAQDLRVLGTADATSDPFDGYSISFPTRVRVKAELTVDAASAGTLALSLYDPISMQFLGDATGTGSVRTLELLGRGTVDLVVRALSGAGAYGLRIVTTSAGSPTFESGDAVGPSELLGAVVVGDTFSYRGTLAAPADLVDELLVPCATAQTVVLAATRTGLADLAIDVLDATTSLSSPTLLETFTSAAPAATNGSLVVAAGRLLAIRLRTANGAGSYVLSVRGQALSAAVVAAAARTTVVSEVAPESVESDRLAQRSLGAPAYGRSEVAADEREALVAFDDADEAAATADIEACGARVVETLSGGVRRVELRRVGGADAAARERADIASVRGLGTGRVRFAERNTLHRPTATEPSDTYYPLQWHYRQLNLPKAWDLTTGSDDVIVAVIDTGVTNHPDLASRLIGGYDFVSSASNSADGNGRDPDPTDPGDAGSSFHGTHVSGTIGARTDDGTGVAGVTWAARIMPLRALGYQGGTDADIAEAIRYAARLSNASGTLPTKRAQVINMSLGGGGFSTTLAAACAAARSAGVVVVAAAGNANRTTPEYPASYDGVISVMALDSRKARAPYSNYGTTVDVAAPGGDTSVDRDGDGYGDGVLSTSATKKNGTVTYGYTFLNGTSMACPHVAGVFALLFARDPDLTVAQAETIVLSTCEDLGAAGRDDTFGYGLVDAYAALLAATPSGGPTPPALPPLLAATPPSINFGVFASTADVDLSNAGGGFVTVSTLTPATASGGPWLSVVPTGGADAGVSVRRIRVEADRASLPTGDHRGSVTIASDGGTLVLDVVLTVLESLPPPPDIEIHVRARSADTGALVQEIVVNPTTLLTWSFPTLPTGRYVFEASTDVDRDGILFEDGDYCGAYPVLSSPLVVDVIAGIPVSGLDFSVSLRRVLEAAAR